MTPWPKWTAAQRTAVKDTAWVLSKRGYVVHELCYADHGCGSPGKVPHSTKWNEGGVKTERQLARLFRKKCNIGVRATPDLLMVDCDVKTDEAGVTRSGIVEFFQMFHERNLVVPLPTLITGGGGAHFWYRVPEGTDLACNRKLGKLIDTRTGGRDKTGKTVKVGQVVIPPSVHHSGSLYRWGPGTPPPLAELPEAPDFILEPLLWVEPAATRERPQYRLELPDGTAGF